MDFHGWLQWLTAEQADAAQRAARRAGMSIGVISDLAVGAHPGGADAWAGQDVIVTGVSVGAPPDEFNQRGQDWTLPPWHPGWLAARAGQPLAELIAATTTDTGLSGQADYDPNWYPTGVKITNAQLMAVPLEPHDFHGEWNYTIAQSNAA